VHRVAPIPVLILLGLSMGLPGCSLFKKTPNDPAPSPQSQLPPPKFPTGDPLAKPASASNNGANTAILAGRVLEGNSRPPINTSVFVVRVDKEEKGEPIDVPVSPEGYFTINNLAPGGQYKLVARGKTGDRMVAGTYVATAPSTRGLLIQMSENLVASNTPPLPEPFDTLKGKRDPAFANDTNAAAPTVAVLPPTNDAPSPSGPANASWQPGNAGIHANVPAGGGLPPVQIPVAGEGPIAQMRGGINSLPALEIPRSPAPRMASIAPIDVPLPGAPPARPREAGLGQTRVPSCVLVGNQLVNFALEDINGQPWELRSNRQGKLVLLDFWGTWCQPCKMTMPTLKGLQQRYGPAGLEVVGIAYEHGGSREEQAHKVNDTCKQLLVNYRQLLGSGPNCVVQRELGVRAFPTLILIDEQGTIVWRHVGELTDGSRGDLERILQSKLRTTVY
jgi:thiol-disulfide isomerase/thioredoxin